MKVTDDLGERPGMWEVGLGDDKRESENQEEEKMLDTLYVSWTLLGLPFAGCEIGILRQALTFSHYQSDRPVYQSKPLQLRHHLQFVYPS